MHILVTNDDGVTAPGLLALTQALRQFGEVSVVAPDHDWSGCGQTKHFKRPLRVEIIRLADGTDAHATDGSPADCVALALMGLLPQKVDLVVAGINSAANLGQDVLYSGTVAAVKEANIWGVPGVAVSLDVQRHQQSLRNYPLAAAVAVEVVETMLRQPFPADVFLNVNVPDVADEQFRGLRFTQQGQRIYQDKLEKRRDPRGETYYWISGEAPTGLPTEGTDIGAIAQRYAAITPLQLDLTAYHILAQPVEWSWPPVSVLHSNGSAAQTAVVPSANGYVSR